MKLALTTLAFAIATISPLSTLRAAEEAYKIDPVHSTMSFRVRHLGISYVTGRFGKFEGTVHFDKDAPEKSKIEVSVAALSVDTNNEKRDAHLNGDDFFSVDKHPSLTFKSTAVKKIDDTHYDVTGDFTMLGVTKSITVKVEDLGAAKDPQGKDRRGGATEFTLDRTLFGMKYGEGMIGTDVKVDLAFSAIKQ